VPYAPENNAPIQREFKAVATAVDAIAAAEAADAAATAEADQVATALVSRMGRTRHPVPDVFADSDTDESDIAHEIDDSAPADRAAAADAEGPAVDDASDVPQDRGALLRLFSALKE
jgi:hypothetical protein